MSAGDHGSHLQERDDQSGRDEQIPEDSLCAGLQLQDGADLQGLQHAALWQVTALFSLHNPSVGPAMLNRHEPQFLVNG